MFEIDPFLVKILKTKSFDILYLKSQNIFACLAHVHLFMNRQTINRLHIIRNIK